MGMCKTSNFSIFAFTKDNYLKILHMFLQQLCVSHD